MPSWPLSLNFIVPPHSAQFGFGGVLEPEAYLERLGLFMGAAEEIGLTGAFVYDFPVALDPWLAAFDVLAGSRALEPIVAVRPHQERPESVARRVADLGYRFRRPTHVNVVAGATRSSRADDRGDKVAARAELGRFAAQLKVELERRSDPAVGRSLILTPASSTPGLVPADGVLMMARPRPLLAEGIERARKEQQVERISMLVGFVVRDTEEEAWEAAARLSVPDRRQQVAGRMFMAQVVSSEHAVSYGLAERSELHDERLWYGAPARGIDAPKLVGSVAQVAAWLASCRELGVTDLIVDLPNDAAEYAFTGRVLRACGLSAGVPNGPEADAPRGD
ncbi:LLM class flavin-dependent oxidoreductase [Streptomyces sp. NPDC001034]|uniref:LLM class flavin-dependent oxidoreductase n=1 Tax=Streptomyces sp. NPDC001034 TaxID=3154375 RepID=UPI003319BAD7